MVLKTDDTVWVTGWNKYGQLGDGTNDDMLEFKKVEFKKDTSGQCDTKGMLGLGFQYDTEIVCIRSVCV